MPFIVPALEPNLVGRNDFGACKLPARMPDSGGAPGTGVVHLRGMVAVGPLYQQPPGPPSGLVPLFTLPAGMRPRTERWLTAIRSGHLGMYDFRPVLLVVFPGGQVQAQLGAQAPSEDGGIFLDGLSFVAEQ